MQFDTGYVRHCTHLDRDFFALNMDAGWLLKGDVGRKFIWKSFLGDDAMARQGGKELTRSKSVLGIRSAESR